MALIAGIEALSTTAELLFTATNGSAGAEQGFLVMNTSTTASEIVYIGGIGVLTDGTLGFPLENGESVNLKLISGDEVWAVSASGTPSVRFLYNKD